LLLELDSGEKREYDLFFAPNKKEKEKETRWYMQWRFSSRQDAQPKLLLTTDEEEVEEEEERIWDIYQVSTATFNCHCLMDVVATPPREGRC
jgi:hypothetical protein